MVNGPKIFQILGMNEEQQPVKYLGVPLASEYINSAQCSTLLQILTTGLESWDSDLLSTAERAQSIQSVVFPIVLYWLLIYHLPASILRKNESLCANYFRT